jgi:hypothetical protein
MPRTRSDDGVTPLHERLRHITRRQFPTATTVLLHPRLVRRAGCLMEQTVITGVDAQGRPLAPLRPEELPEWQDAVTAQHGSGFLVLSVA